MALSILWMESFQHSLSGVFHSRGTGLQVSVYRCNEDILDDNYLDPPPHIQQSKRQ